MQPTGIKSPGMKIIPMMVVLICASGSSHHGPSPWKASALELPIPGLGRVKVEFHADRTSENPPVGSAMERQSGKVSEDDGKQAEQAITTITEGKGKPTEAPTASTEVKDKSTEASAKAITVAASKPAEATTATTEVKDKSTDASAKPPTVSKESGNQQPQATTVAAKSNDDSKSSTTEASDPDDFDDIDIWDDTEDPPEEFGREYDLDPGLLNAGGNDLGDFQPKLPLPPNMMKDMFFESSGEEKSSDQEDDDVEGRGIFERIKRFFSIANIKEQLDTIPGKMQAMMDRFRQKKSDGLKKLREEMDGCSEKLGQKIAEALSKLKVPKQDCVRQIDESFKRYEEALQDGIQPCMNEVQSVTSKQESALRNAQSKFTRMLTDMQDCVNKLDSSGLNSLVKSILNVGSCTKKNIQSKIADSLQPQMKRLSEMFQKQSSKLDGNMNATGLCVERQLQLPKFQKMQQEIVAKGKQCLERSG